MMNKKKIFFATPISAFSDKMEYKKYRCVMSELIDTLKNESKNHMKKQSSQVFFFK